MLRMSLPSSGANGAMSIEPPKAILASTGAAPRGSVPEPFTVKLVLPPAVTRASDRSVPAPRLTPSKVLPRSGSGPTNVRILPAVARPPVDSNAAFTLTGWLSSS